MKSRLLPANKRPASDAWTRDSAMIDTMASFIVHQINSDLEVHIAPEMPRLPAALEARIEFLWRRAVARVEAGGAGRLFNGRICSIDTIAPGRITGHLTEYRRHVAQLEDHSLFAELGIRALAACGVSRCSDGIAIGRRPNNAIHQPGMWELCPAGSIDVGAVGADGTADYRAQLLTELREELGLDANVVSDVIPLCLLEHPGSHICDLSMTVRVALDANAVLTAHRTLGDGEYDPLRIVPIADLPAFINRAGDLLAPTVPLFLAEAGLIGRP
jgi:hypothetical protein